MRKYQILKDLLETKRNKIEKVIITVPVTDGHLSAVSQALEIGVSAEYALANIGTVDSEEFGVEVLFKNGVLQVFESGLGGIYEDDDRDSRYRAHQVKKLNPRVTLDKIVDMVIALSEALGEGEEE